MSKIKTVSRVLDIKDRKKEEIENEVRQLRSQIKELEAKLAALESKFQDASRQFEEKQRIDGMNVHGLELFYNYFIKLNEDITNQKKVVVARLSDLGLRQQALIEAYKEKKIFEVMKDRIIRDEMTDRERAEQKEQDFLHLAKRQREQ